MESVPHAQKTLLRKATLCKLIERNAHISPQSEINVVANKRELKLQYRYDYQTTTETTKDANKQSLQSRWPRPPELQLPSRVAASAGLKGAHLRVREVWAQQMCCQE